MKLLRTYAMVFFVSVTILIVGITTWPLTNDEPWYVGAARNFINGTPTINPEHPPLAKYFIALSIKAFGDAQFGWRFPSVLAGALVALSVFGLAFRLTGDCRAAYVAWFLIMANGFWYVMSRLAMIPIIELAFEAAGVWVFVIALQDQRLRWFAWSGALFGLSVGSRWCGAVGFAVCLLYGLFYCRQFIKRASVMVGTAIAVYIASWIPLLIREQRSPGYLITANRFIFEFHRHFKDYPHVGQPWWTWIFRLDPQPSLSYLVGNPVIGVLGLAAVALLLWQKKPLLPALYLAHVLQWAIGVKPMTFYYYYFEAFMWLTVALAVALQSVPMRKARLDLVVAGCASVMFELWYTHWYAM
jgi:dolichyl-phosphate-mannose-protein mannosyltransferase